LPTWSTSTFETAYNTYESDQRKKDDATSATSAALVLYFLLDIFFVKQEDIFSFEEENIYDLLRSTVITVEADSPAVLVAGLLLLANIF
jgi:hypothetical protein